jgi:hypothetical protein
MIAETEILESDVHAASIETGARVHSNPRESVVIPAFSIAPYIAESLKSVLAQTFREFEIILVNDDSDDTAALEKTIVPFRDQIIYIRQQNAGAAARNAGMFDESPLWKREQDFELWFRLAKRGAAIGYQKRILLKYRIRAGSLPGNEIERAERNDVALDGIKQKFALTPPEKANKQMKHSQAFLCTEKGKAALARDDFVAARDEFAKARTFEKNLKLTAVLFALRLAPGVFARLYQRWLN